MNKYVYDGLRKKIEGEYHQKLAALDMVYAIAVSGNADGATRGPYKSSRSGGTYRARVLEALTDEWQSIDELQSKTGVAAARIRGVVYSNKRDALGIAFQRTKSGAQFRVAAAEVQKRQGTTESPAAGV